MGVSSATTLALCGLLLVLFVAPHTLATGLFPAHANLAAITQPFASQTCGVNSPTDYCDVSVTGTTLKCNTKHNCTNTACPSGSVLPPPSIDVFGQSIANGAVSIAIPTSTTLAPSIRERPPILDRNSAGETW